jgi:hypothetical protein
MRDDSDNLPIESKRCGTRLKTEGKQQSQLALHTITCSDSSPLESHKLGFTVIVISVTAASCDQEDRIH